MRHRSDTAQQTELQHQHANNMKLRTQSQNPLKKTVCSFSSSSISRWAVSHPAPVAGTIPSPCRHPTTPPFPTALSDQFLDGGVETEDGRTDQHLAAATESLEEPTSNPTAAFWSCGLVIEGLNAALSCASSSSVPERVDSLETRCRSSLSATLESDRGSVLPEPRGPWEVKRMVLVREIEREERRGIIECSIAVWKRMVLQ